jgi:hypothetical protein
MPDISVRGVMTVLMLQPAIWSLPAWALDPGNFAVQCASSERASGESGEYKIRMDMIDILTLRRSLGTIISGVRLDDGRRVVLTGDRGCVLIEVDGPRTTTIK